MKQRARRYDFLADAEVKIAITCAFPRRVTGVFVHMGGIAGYAKDGRITFFGSEWGSQNAVAYMTEPVEASYVDAIIGRWVRLCAKRQQMVAA